MLRSLAMVMMMPLLACSAGEHKSAAQTTPGGVAATDQDKATGDIPLSLVVSPAGLGLADSVADYALKVSCQVFGAAWVKTFSKAQLDGSQAKLPQQATACYAYLSSLQVSPSTTTSWSFKPTIGASDAQLFNSYQAGKTETYGQTVANASDTITALMTLTTPFTVSASGAVVAYKFAINDTSTAATAIGFDVTLPPPVIKFGLLFNNMQCGMCHLDVHGTIVSVSDVLPMRNDTNGHVFGKWLINGAYHAADNFTSGAIKVDGGVVPNYNNSGKELPVDSTGKPVFPAIDFSNLSTQMHGTLTADDTASTVHSVSKTYTGNTVLVGTAAKPIQINRDILVQGDLVLKGVYQGVGTIYATGNIYITANLTAVHSPTFPYSDVTATADAQAALDIKNDYDALGIASGSNIFLGDLENYDGTFGGNWNPAQTGPGPGGVKHQGIYENVADNQPRFFSVNTGMYKVYSWLPEASFQMYYETVPACSTFGVVANSGNEGRRAFNRIDAVLYSKNTIGGVARGTTYNINGGVIAQDLHIIADSATGTCGNSAINYDARLRNGGLQILQQLAKFFPQ